MRWSNEDAEHIVVAEYLDALGVRWFHCPNGGHRFPSVGRKLRKMGVKPGVPDFIIVDPPPGIPDAVGVAVELKANGGRVTKAQREWLDDLQDRRWLAMVAIGAGDAISKLAACGYVSGGKE